MRSAAIPKSQLWLAEAMLLAVAIVWGASYGLVKTAVLFYPVLAFLALRFGITFVLLVPFLARLRPHEVRETVLRGLPLGLIMLSVFISETYGVALTRAANAAFLISLCVVFTPFMEWLILHRRPTWGSLIAVCVSFLGVALLTQTSELSFNFGDGLIVLAAILRALTVTVTTLLTAGRNIQALPLTCVQTGTVALGSLILALVVIPGGLPPVPTDPTFIGVTAFLVVFCTLFAFFAQNYALRRISPTRVSLLMGTEPVFGALFAMVWLQEMLTPMAWFGGLLIVAASVWAAFKPKN